MGQMLTPAKDEPISAVVPTEMKSQIRRAAIAGGYESISAFLRAAISEKLAADERLAARQSGGQR